jgi:hypothetical protein
MQYVRQAGSDPSFLLKALSEAGGELRRNYHGLSRRLLLAPGAGIDEGWSLLAIAVHMRDTERGVADQVDAILSRHQPEIRHVDFDDIPFAEDVRDADEDEVLDEFRWRRRHSSYMMWDLEPADWERCGIHPYRGPLSLLQIARELYQHDLEHLWQARRMLEALENRRR